MTVADQIHDGWLALSPKKTRHKTATSCGLFGGGSLVRLLSSLYPLQRRLSEASLQLQTKKEPDSFQSTVDSSVLLDISQDHTYTFGLK